MPICIGKKACDRARCKKRCKSWFLGMDDLLGMCRSACSEHANEIQTRDDFLCSGRWVNDDRILAQYNIDGCSTNDYSYDEFAGEGKADLWSSTMPIIILLALLVVGLAAYFLFKK